MKWDEKTKTIEIVEGEDLLETAEKLIKNGAGAKETRTIEVKVDYTEDEINVLAKKVADLNGKKVGLEIEKAAEMKHYKGLIDEKEEEINSLCKDIRYGYQFVPTLCTLEFNYEKNQKEYISVDTGKVIQAEAIASEMDSLFQKPLDEGEYPESETPPQPSPEGREKDEDFENTEDNNGTTIMEFITDEPMSSPVPEAIPQWGDLLKSEGVNE